jgi:hypothetical protein
MFALPMNDVEHPPRRRPNHRRPQLLRSVPVSGTATCAKQEAFIRFRVHFNSTIAVAGDGHAPATPALFRFP